MEGGGLVSMLFEYHHFPPITTKMIRSPDDAADLAELEPITPGTPGVLYVFLTRAFILDFPSRAPRRHYPD